MVTKLNKILNWTDLDLLKITITSIKKAYGRHPRLRMVISFPPNLRITVLLRWCFYKISVYHGLLYFI